MLEALRNRASSGGATSNREPPSMPLLAELIVFSVAAAIKISLLRSCFSNLLGRNAFTAFGCRLAFSPLPTPFQKWPTPQAP